MKKKILAALLVLTMVVGLTACSNTDDESADENTTTRTQVDYESLDEINEAVGCNLTQPGTMGISDESYSVLDGTIAQYKYTINGIPYTYRASATTEDISDIYSGEALLIDSIDDNGYAADDTYKLAEWYVTENDVDMQYVIVAEDNGTLDESAFMEIVAELQPASAGVVSDEEVAPQVYEAIAGEYTDSTSQRATATVVNNGENVTITVSWADSASARTEWTMTATYDSTYGLVYTDCVEKNITCNDDGTVASEEIVSENVAGNFGIDGQANLLWIGAAEENCQACVFVKNA